MDSLIMECKKVPVYMKSFYKWTPEPSMLKQDVCWDNPIMENLECPYCREEDPQDIFNDGNFFIYVDPCGYLRFGNSDGIGVVDIMFCPMCGKSFK